MTDAPAENAQELIAEFVDEARASLESLPELLARFTAQPEVEEPIHGVFRAVHSIKGCAGFLGLAAVKAFSHSLENTLDEVRNRKLNCRDELRRSLVEMLDILDGLLEQALSDPAAGLTAEQQAALDHLGEVAQSCRVDPENALLDQMLQLAREIAATGHPSAAQWASRLEGLVADQQLSDEPDEELGAAAPKRPKASELANRTFRCGAADAAAQVQGVLELFLRAEQGEHDRAAGERFVAGAQSLAELCDQQSQAAPAAQLRQAVTEYQTLLNSPLDVDANLLSIVWDTLELALSALAIDTSAPREGEAGAAKAETSKARVLRVREDRLDEFLRHVSSLFITCELYKDLQQRMAGSDDRAALLDEMRQINRDFSAQSADLQQHVLALTRVSAAGLFSKFPKMARGLATQLGKQVEVIVEGEDTEFDKALIDDLDAALTHLVRNVMDHGLETPEDRTRAGKSPVGKLWLTAEQTRTHTLITVRDNGRGIDADRVRRKAVEKEVLTQAKADALTDQEAVELIFHAGFSTAEQVSEVSGRGVGMDAVRATLAAHGGRVLLETQLGQGTVFRLEIPIRSAVLVVDGLMLEERGVPFVVAFEHIREIIGIVPTDLKSVRGECIAQVRGQPYHAARLGKLVGLPESEEAPGTPTGIVVSCRAGAACLLVEKVRGHRQVVVSPLRQILPKARRVSGVARLGGGRLALVLDVEDLIRCMQS